MEQRNAFNESFADSYPRNLSPMKFKSYTVYIPKKDDYDKENAQENVANVAPHVVEGSE